MCTRNWKIIWIFLSKTRQHALSCTLCSCSVSLVASEGKNCGLQCSQCRLVLCTECLRTSHVETAPRMFADYEWTCSKCYKDGEECVVCGVGGSLITCDGCNKDRCFPCAALDEESVPDGDWYCKPCSDKKLLLGSRVRVLVSFDGSLFKPILLTSVFSV